MLKCDDIRVSGQDMATLLMIFKHFKDQKGNADKRISLQEWATRHSAEMSEMEATKRLRAFSTEASSADALKNVAFDSNYIIDLFAKMPKELKPETREALHAAINNLLLKTLREVTTAADG